MEHNGTDLAGESMSRVGLGYGIAIAVGILVLVSTIMLASYVCVRVHGRGQSGGVGERENVNGSSSSSSLGASAAAATAAASGTRGVVGRRNGGDWLGGLDQVTLESYPKIVYTSKQPLPHPQDTACAICLADYRESELLRMLPDCRHVFHVQCIDSWMRLQATCPMCRTSPLPTPLSTPLSELIPLARHPLHS